MITEVFITGANSKIWGCNEQGEWSGCLDEAIIKRVFDSELFWDISKEKNNIQVDWGCWVLKLSKKDLIAFLSKEKYKENQSAKELVTIANTLEDEKGYLLGAIEDISAPWN